MQITENSPAGVCIHIYRSARRMMIFFYKPIRLDSIDGRLITMRLGRGVDVLNLDHSLTSYARRWSLKYFS